MFYAFEIKQPIKTGTLCKTRETAFSVQTSFEWLECAEAETELNADCSKMLAREQKW